MWVLMPVTNGVYDMSFDEDKRLSENGKFEKFMSEIFIMHIYEQSRYLPASSLSYCCITSFCLPTEAYHRQTVFLAWKQPEGSPMSHIPRPMKSISGPVAFGAGGGASGYR